LGDREGRRVPQGLKCLRYAYSKLAAQAEQGHSRIPWRDYAGRPRRMAYGFGGEAAGSGGSAGFSMRPGDVLSNAAR